MLNVMTYIFFKSFPGLDDALWYFLFVHLIYLLYIILTGQHKIIEEQMANLVWVLLNLS